MTKIVPAEALTSHIGVLGKTGSGKSNLAKVLAEGLMQAGERVGALDPTGTWWGLRLAEDGKRPSRFKPVIFGGAHADLALTDQHGAVLGEALGTSAGSFILDVQQMTVGQRTRFAGAFAEALLRSNRGPLYFIIDEAHLFAPQGRVSDPQSSAMLHAFNNLVSLGRGRGLRIILISQRPAKLHKDSLTQVETLIAMRLIAPQDRAAVKDWMGEWAGDGTDILADLPALATGEGFVWAPQQGYLQRTKFPLAATFDSGRPEANAEKRDLPPIDIALIGEKMDAIRQEAMDNDPRRLRARIAELEKLKAPPAVDPEVLKEAARRGYESGKTAGIGIGLVRAQRALGALQIADIAAEDEGAAFVYVAPEQRPAAQAKVNKLASDGLRRLTGEPPQRPKPAPTPSVEPGQFTGPQTKVLRALSMWKALGKLQPSKAMVGMVAGYASNGSTLRNILSELRTAGAIDYPSAGNVSLLADPIDMTAAEGRQIFLDNLSGPQRKIVDALTAGGEMTKADLGATTGYEPGGSTLRNLLSELRTLGIVDYPSKGSVAMEGWVFEII